MFTSLPIVMDENLLKIVNFWILTPISLFFRCILILSVVVILRRLWVYGKKNGRVAVVVLGDVGRSPRMSYHSLSLANHGFKVNLVGYSGSIPHKLILESSNIDIKYLKNVPTFSGIPRFLVYVLKVVWQSISLLWVLCWKVNASEYILVQNPPCIPTLAICFFLSLWNGSKLIIDWHNYGYSILSLSLHEDHPIVKIAKWYEETFGQLSVGNLCVTNAMKSDLENRWHICAEVMHDRPSQKFQKLNTKGKHALFKKLSRDYSHFSSSEDESGTRFTSCDTDGNVDMKSNRPALIISSTSWTDDEDFSVLLDALQLYENAVHKTSDLPDLLCAITGKGPNKAHYQDILSLKDWHHVEVITPWLEAEDYPTLLACGDLGVSLHTSSSGLDLPMKVVDMFGAGLPVAAINFSCLSELVQKDVNGFVFDTAEELSQQLLSAFKNFPNDQTTLKKFCKNVDKFRERTWDVSWDEIVLPMFRS